MSDVNSQSNFIFPNTYAFETEAVNLVSESGMLRSGHWRFASGQHANTKADFDFLSSNLESLDRVAAMMSAQVVEAVELNDLPSPDLIVGVPKGAEDLARGMVPHLEAAFNKRIPQLYVTKFPDFRPVRFWVTDPDNQTGVLEETDMTTLSLLGVEDVTTTWGSTRGAIKAITAAGLSFYGKTIQPMAMASFAERTGGNREQGGDPIRLSIAKLDVGQWKPEDCVDCKNLVPIDMDIGKPATQQVVEHVLGLGANQTREILQSKGFTNSSRPIIVCRKAYASSV